ncbi:hypothetical protein NA57DRAFT_80161 [Rhizodiscina lignyota]|uniref:Uncharacterized protein n=1 Tax=Rhizodiscina lignyota TaxID=1504668 RepID=A0A9P4M270_9PEZI|nr:hypothetical protein NA57DRAFT_80161 [Rhizodiscina lignyota]
MPPNPTAVWFVLFFHFILATGGPPAPDRLYYLVNAYTGPNYNLQPDPAAEDSTTHVNGLRTAQWTDYAFGVTIINNNQFLFFNPAVEFLGIDLAYNTTINHVVAEYSANWNGLPQFRWTLVDSGNSAYPYKLSNALVGPGWYLDTYSDTHGVFMSTGDYSGQY